MEFPISRKSLQTYRANDAQAVETKQAVLKEIQKICKDVEKKVLTTNDRRYIYYIPQVIKHDDLMPMHSPVIIAKPDGFLKGLLDSIKNTFPDCTITMDPLETYILIDWS